MTLLANYYILNCHNLISRPRSGTYINNVYGHISRKLSEDNVISIRIDVKSDFDEEAHIYCNFDRTKRYIQSKFP